jgi:transcriptional regulator with XRE-family HTH domain
MPAKKTPKAKPVKKAKRRAKARRHPKAVKGAKSATGFDLPKALKAKLKGAGLSKAAAAKRIGVTGLSLRHTLSGKSSPNARTIKRYAAFVGVPVKQLTGGKAAKPKARRGRPPGSGKKRGRPPGKGKGRRGRPPGRQKAITIKAGRFPKGQMTKIAKARKAVEEIINDKLAILVHNLSAGERAKLQKILR